MKHYAITAHTAEGDTIRLSIGEYLPGTKEIDWSNGIDLKGIYFGTKWVVVETYSRWDDGHGRDLGTNYRAYRIGQDNVDILRLCENVGIEPPKGIKAEEA